MSGEMMKKFTACFALFLAALILNGAVVWENDLPAALAMYSASGSAAAPAIEEEAFAVTSKKGAVYVTRKNVNIPAENNNVSLRIKVPAGRGIIHCYFATDSEPQLSESKKFSLFFRSSGDWQTVNFDCSKLPLWKGTITAFRMDFYAPPGGKILFKEAKFSGPADLPCSWHFASPGARAWNWRAALSAPAEIVNGAMQLKFAKKYSIAPTIPVYMDCANYTTLTLRVKTDKPGRVGGVIYFKTKADPNLNEKQKVTFTFNATGEYQEIRVPLNKYAAWKGTVTAIRMDLSVASAPCTLEISDIVFSAKDNLAGLKNSGREFGPFRDLPPGREFDLSFNSAAAGKGSLFIENAYGDIIEKKALRVSPGINGTKFTVPGNGAAVFFSFESGVSGLTIRPVPQGAPDNWTASWIADKENFKKRSHQYFQKEVVLDSTPLDCRFQGTADDRLDLYINGKKVILPESSWRKPRTADVTNFFRQGKNLIAFHLENNGEASGLLANFSILTADGKVTKVDTDATFLSIRDPQADWMTTPAPANTAFAPLVVGPYDVPPWGNWCLMPYENFTRRDQLSARNTTLTPIKGGVHLETEITAEMLREPLKKIAVQAVADNTIIAREDILLPEKLVTGSSMKIKQDLFAGKLLKDNYVLQLSGDTTHTRTPDELTFTVSENPDLKPNISSEIRQTVSGPALFINGQAFDEMIFYSSVLDSMQEHYDAGYRFFMIGIGTNVGKGLTTPGWNENGYDFTAVTRNLNRVLAKFPDIRIILTFGIDAPYWWHKRYPDQGIYLDGKATHENLASPASEQWRKDGAEFIKAIITHFENSPFRHQIAGYRLSSLCDGGEWQYPGVWANPRRHGDFSTAMRSYFREFLRKKYGANCDVSKIKVPSGKERQIAGETWFRDPEKEQLVIDYIECQSDAVATAAIHFLRVAKEAAKGKIVGIYGGYLLFYSGFPVQNIGHLAFRKVYQSKAADFFCGPIDYHLRKLGLPGGNMASISSLKLHGATYFQENDTRTFLNRSPSHRHVDNLYESASVLLRESAIGMVSQTPIYTCDLTGNSYRNQGLIETGKILNDSFKKCFNPAKVVKPQVALLYSIDSLPYLIEKNDALTEASSYFLRINVGKSGAMADTYLLEDILTDNFPADQYKCFVIVNGFYLTDEIRNAIQKKLCRNGASIIFTPGAGIFKDKKLSAKGIEEVTGFPAVAVKGKMPFIPADLGDKPFITRTYSDHKKTVLATTELTPELYRSLFQAAGVHIWMKSNDTINTNGDSCFIHAASDGIKEITLPFAAGVTDLITGKKVPTSADGKSFTVKMRKYETRLYKFEEK